MENTIENYEAESRKVEFGISTEIFMIDEPLPLTEVDVADVLISDDTINILPF